MAKKQGKKLKGGVMPPRSEGLPQRTPEEVINSVLDGIRRGTSHRPTGKGK